MYQQIVLDNGLRLITVEMPSTKTVTVLVAVRCGSRYETKALSGISHFLEHMAFKGTKKRPTPRDVVETIDRIGGENNAFTSQDSTWYYAKVDAKHTEVALDFVSDLFLNAKIEPQEVEKERRVILEELKKYEDMPARKVWSLFNEVLYGDQPAGWDVGGTKETVGAIKPEQIIDYRHIYYRTESTIICVAGNIKPKEIARKVKYLFAQAKKGGGPAKAPIVDVQDAPRAKLTTKKTDQTQIVLGFKAFPYSHPDRFAAHVLATVLGVGMSSRLFQRIREQLSLAYSVFADVDFTDDAGVFAAAAGVDNERYALALREILKEFKRLKEEKVAEQELRKAKDLFIGKLNLNLEASDEVANFYTAQAVLKGEVLTPEEVIRRIEAVGAADVMRVAKAIFTTKRLNLAMIGPFKAPKQLEGEIARSLRI